MSSSVNPSDRHPFIRALFDEYIEMYAARDARLTERFSDNFSGYTGSDDFLVGDRQAWQAITRQDFAQVPERIRMEMLDYVAQDLSPEVVMCTASFHIHLPIAEHVLANEVARLVLVFRLEGADWKIAHSSISIPYPCAQDGEVYPLATLREKNQALEALVAQRTQALLASEALYRSLTEDTRDVIWRADKHLRVTYISPADQRLRGFPPEEVLGHHVLEFFTDAGVAQVKRLLHDTKLARAAGRAGQFVRFEAPHRCKDGQVIWGEVISRPELDAQGEVVGHHGITREITKRKLLEEQVQQLAFNDPLTHLANRRLLDDRLSQALAACKRSGNFGALLFLDLDNFKPLNDEHGHAVGDLLLVEVASRLSACVRQVDTVSRFGGDEFVVLLAELSPELEPSASQARALAEKVRHKLAEPYVLTVLQEGLPAQVVTHHCSASIGLAVFNGQCAAQQILKTADAAMYQAKEAGRNAVRFEGSGLVPLG